MLFIVGVVVVFLSVFGGYAAIGGRLDILWQPFEAVIICVATAGAYVIANPMPVLTRTMGAIIGIIKGPRYNKDNYIELLSMMYQLFRLAKTTSSSGWPRPRACWRWKPTSRTRTRASCSRNSPRSTATITCCCSCVTTCA